MYIADMILYMLSRANIPADGMRGVLQQCYTMFVFRATYNIDKSLNNYEYCYLNIENTSEAVMDILF